MQKFVSISPAKNMDTKCIRNSPMVYHLIDTHSLSALVNPETYCLCSIFRLPSAHTVHMELWHSQPQGVAGIKNLKKRIIQPCKLNGLDRLHLRCPQLSLTENCCPSRMLAYIQSSGAFKNIPLSECTPESFCICIFFLSLLNQMVLCSMFYPWPLIAVGCCNLPYLHLVSYMCLNS